MMVIQYTSRNKHTNTKYKEKHLFTRLHNSKLVLKKKYLSMEIKQTTLISKTNNGFDAFTKTTERGYIGISLRHLQQLHLLSYSFQGLQHDYAVSPDDL